MRVVIKSLFVLALVLIVPTVAFAQASIVGIAKDTSGAVLPGVNVEASSDVLIEKVRSTVTDANGRYQLLDLRPGTYIVIFTLQGFNTVRREGFVLSGSGAVTIDADLRVGALAETVTVTGETPLVDVRNTTRQAVLTADLIESLPTSRNFVTLARMIPGISGGGNDVGGSVLQDVGAALTVRGSQPSDARITLNGISVMTLQAGGGLGGQQPDPGSAAEVTVDTSSLSADLASGGPRINFIPRDGGNKWSNSGFFTYSTAGMQGDNFTDALKAAGLPTPNRIQRNFDISEAFGGPVKRDKLWFWFSGRYNSVASEVAVLENKNAWNPNSFLYEPLDGQPGVNRGTVEQSSLRLTWQATPRNKIAGTYKMDRWCNCPNNVSATVSPEAGRDRRFPRLRQEHLEWTSPVTNSLMFEAVGMHLFERWGNMHLQPAGSLDAARSALLPQMIGVLEQSTNRTYRQQTAPYNNTLVPNYSYRAAMSYVTGSHAVKVGFSRTHGFLKNYVYNFVPYSYRFNQGVPNLVTLYATPYTAQSNQDNDLGLYVQDRWTRNRMTLSGALRFDYFGTSFPQQQIGPGFLLPTRDLTFPAKDNLGWKDLSYRSGLAYDVRGDGKTAFKVSLNKYLLGQTLNTLGVTPNPVNALVNQATRTWNDRAGLGINGDYVPQCNLLNPVANGECGPTSPGTFGTPGIVLATFDPDLLTGWGHRQYNWELLVGLQHEIFPRVSVDVGYFRRIWGNFQVTDNLLTTAADYTPFTMNVPTDARLPNSGGTVTGVYNVVDARFTQTQNYNTLSDNYGKQTEHWNGFEVNVNARLRNGAFLQGSVGAAKQVEDNCEIVAKIPEALVVAGSFRPAQYCHRESPFLTQVKAYGVYTVPKVDVQVAGTFRNTAGATINANFVANQAYIAANSTLGRPLSGGTAQNLTVALLGPNSRYLDRRNELDLRFGKILRAGRTRSIVSFDIFNVFNLDIPIAVSQAYATWLVPNEVLNPRLAKVSFQFDF